MIFINLKTYRESTGENAIKLAKTAAEVAGQTRVPIVVAPQAVDIEKVAKIQGISVWAQHIDTNVQGRSTGWLTPEAAKEVGAKGTLLNHSEHKLGEETLRAAIRRAREVGLETLVFAASPEEAKVVIDLSPDWIAYEPPELIASPDTSVARAKPEVIKIVSDVVPIHIKLAVGAGVKDGKDVRASLSLGVRGVALSSAFVLASDPKAVLLEIAEGFKLI